jgi:hypothetical protein
MQEEIIMFKSKRKEKPKRGSRLTNIILLLILILLVAGGAVGYWFYNAYIVAVEPPVIDMTDDSFVSGDVSACSYSQGFGSRENSDLALQLESAFRDADTDIMFVSVEENLAEYRSCGDVVEPIYQMCSLVTIHLPIESPDVSERELGEHIATLLDVLTVQRICTPVELSVIFETPSGSIIWQMSYALALEAYQEGMRGGELYNPSAGR